MLNTLIFISISCLFSSFFKFRKGHILEIRIKPFCGKRKIDFRLKLALLAG